MSESYVNEPGLDFWGSYLTGGIRVVDLVPWGAALVGLTPGLLLARRDGLTLGSALVGAVGGVVGLGAGVTAWFLLPPHEGLSWSGGGGGAPVIPLF